MRIAVCAALFLMGVVSVFSQDEMARRGSIPEELLRPRREEAPHYPIDTVIGALGQGQSPHDAYGVARKTAAALIAGNMDVPVLSSVNKVFLESCMSMLNTINPLYFRLGNGREEPDGSYSFLIRFVGREQGMAGELFIRFEERRSAPPPVATTPENATEIDPETELASAEEDVSAEVMVEPVPLPPPPPVKTAIVEKVWLFEDLILEEARGREEENSESRHRFDFPPYERFF